MCDDAPFILPSMKAKRKPLSEEGRQLIDRVNNQSLFTTRKDPSIYPAIHPPHHHTHASTESEREREGPRERERVKRDRKKTVRHIKIQASWRLDAYRRRREWVYIFQLDSLIVIYVGHLYFSVCMCVDAIDKSIQESEREREREPSSSTKEER